MKPENLPRSTGYIAANRDLCSGCRTCEAVCSLSHENTVRPALSRIGVVTWPFEGYRSEVYTCRQCKDPGCLAACLTGALHIDEVTKARVIDPETCTGCQSCLEACPKKPARIRYDEDKGVCVKCDLCGGDPLCVKYCMEGALCLKKG
jgi:carbon-monoxide dehydrogenase iron sulfur subunit